MIKKFLDYKVLGYFYFFLFMAVVIVEYIPFFNDSNGYLFGLFRLEWWDDLLHLASAAWAFLAMRHSKKQLVLYLGLFGTLYLLDGILGLFTGVGYLDLAIFREGIVDLPLMTRIFANIPHIIIGGSQVVLWWILTNKKDELH